jgi:hypothetical protein
MGSGAAPRKRCPRGPETRKFAFRRDFNVGEARIEVSTERCIPGKLNLGLFHCCRRLTSCQKRRAAKLGCCGESCDYQNDACKNSQMMSSMCGVCDDFINVTVNRRIAPY